MYDRHHLIRFGDAKERPQRVARSFLQFYTPWNVRTATLYKVLIYQIVESCFKCGLRQNANDLFLCAESDASQVQNYLLLKCTALVDDATVIL